MTCGKRGQSAIRKRDSPACMARHETELSLYPLALLMQ
jgi:hypothetical protein